MSVLDELDKLARPSKSQSWVVIEPDRLRQLIDVAKAAKANQKTFQTFPFRQLNENGQTYVVAEKERFEDWCTGTATQLDIALRKLEKEEQ